VLVSQGHRIVYGGAKNGLMGVIADEAIRLGGTVIGVIPALLVDKELLHKGLSVLRLILLSFLSLNQAKPHSKPH
jgi:predicted Rossmann-fold nucleotide-binding protein